jgi:hypothetical protein
MQGVGQNVQLLNVKLVAVILSFTYENNFFPSQLVYSPLNNSNDGQLKHRDTVKKYEFLCLGMTFFLLDNTW